MRLQSLARFGSGDQASLRAMDFGDTHDAVRAKAELAKRHAERMREEARKQRDRARDQRRLEEEAVRAARSSMRLEGQLLRCGHCNAVWTREAVEESTRRKPGCLLCGRPLTPVP
jgi:hypothetical protein